MKELVIITIQLTNMIQYNLNVFTDHYFGYLQTF